MNKPVPFNTYSPKSKKVKQPEPERESWWLKFATGDRDPNFTTAVHVRFANREPDGPILQDWTTP